MWSALEYPENFLCPIMRDIMDDTVTARDGHVRALRNPEWLDNGKRSSPVTSAVMLSTDFISNLLMKSRISSWRDRSRVMQEWITGSR